MSRYTRAASVLVFLNLWIAAPAGFSDAGSEPDRQTAGVLRKIIESALDTRSFTCSGEILCGAELIPSFYERRNFRPAWIEEGALRPEAGVLLSALADADREGLKPRDYHLDKLLRIVVRSLKGGLEPETLAHMDMLLTDAFLMYAAHMTGGRVNPETVHAEWVLPAKKGLDVGGLLDTFLASNDPRGVLASFRPPYERYRPLRDALQRYEALAEKGGWASVPSGPALRSGDRGPRVELLRRRLEIAGDLAAGEGVAGEFGDEIERAVRRFQMRHGLLVDGIAGRQTLAAMNVPARARVQQIRLNLERWRWLPRDLENPHVLVNIADYSLFVVEDERPVIRMKVVVGRQYRRTPVFSDTIRYLVLNPHWTVPTTIAIKDMLPRLREDPDYLEMERIRLFKGWGEDAPEVDGRTVDWRRYGRGNFPFRLLQEPGPQNALGRIKFMFPNKFDVYLHDTKDTGLFEKTDRSFSSGCIRVEKPIELAAYLLKNQPGWTADRIEETLSRGQTKTLMLSRPVAVHIQYWTAWVDETAAVHFRKDIYGRDERLGRALDERLPRLEYHLQEASSTRS